MKPTLEKKPEHIKSKSLLLLRGENNSRSPKNKRNGNKKIEDCVLKPNSNIMNQKVSSEMIPSQYFLNILNKSTTNNSYSSRFSKVQQQKKSQREKEIVLQECGLTKAKSQETQINGICKKTLKYFCFF